MSIKMLSAKLKNYGPISELKCKFFDGVTTFVGLNGSGKSKILESIVSCVKGVAKKSGGIVGDRYRFIGSLGKSSDVEYEFIDENTGTTFFIKNHITASSNSISIRTSDGEPIGEEWLRCFMNVSLMSATAFSQLPGKEQAEMLGIDVSSFDNELEKLKQEATELRAQIKSFGDIEVVEKVEKIDIAELNKLEAEIEANLNSQYISNRNENEKRRKKNLEVEKEAEDVIKKWHDETHKRVELKMFLEDALIRLVNNGYKGKEVQEFIETFPEPDPEPNIVMNKLELIEPEMPDNTELKEIRAQIEAAWENNARAQEYLTYKNIIDDRETLKKRLSENFDARVECIAARNEYLSSHDFGFKGLSVDLNGDLVLSVNGENARPLKQPFFSKGEMEMIMARLHIAMNPEFRVRFIDDFECITEPNDEKILKMLLDNGFQVVVAEARKPGKRENEIVIKECKIETEEDEREALL
jgi:hypothetical protein